MGLIGGMKNCQWVRLGTDAQGRLVLAELQHDLDRDAEAPARSLAYRYRLRTRVVDRLRRHR